MLAMINRFFLIRYPKRSGNVRVKYQYMINNKLFGDQRSYLQKNDNVLIYIDIIVCVIGKYAYLHDCNETILLYLNFEIQ